MRPYCQGSCAADRALTSHLRADKLSVTGHLSRAAEIDSSDAVTVMFLARFLAPRAGVSWRGGAPVGQGVASALDLGDDVLGGGFPDERFGSVFQCSVQVVMAAPALVKSGDWAALAGSQSR